MKRTIRNRTVRLVLLVGFVFTIVLLTIRHYLGGITFTAVRSGNQSVVQIITLLNSTIELTQELGNPPDNQLTDSSTQIFYKKNRPIRQTVAIRLLLDSLLSLTKQTPELGPITRQVQDEAEIILQSGLTSKGRSGEAVQRLMQLLRTVRLDLTRSLLDDQKRIREHVNTSRTLNTIIDGLVLFLAFSLLFAFYYYTLRRERLTRQVIYRQKELTQYLEAIPEGVVVLNTDNQLVYVNQAAQELMNSSLNAGPVSLSDWTSQFRLVHADSKLPFEPAELPISRALRGEAVSIENLLLEAARGPRLLSTHARPLYDREGELMGAISIFRDITEANLKEQELEQARSIADQSLTEREIFLANISHDIRTPLNAILGFAELLRQNRTTPEEQGYLNGINLSGNNLLALINELLDISSLESGQLVLEPVPTQIDVIIQTIEANLSAQASEKSLRYEVLSDPAVPPTIVADPFRLTQLLLYFCAHAVKFTKEGLIKFEVDVEESDLPGFVTTVFRIKDAGIGIAEENLSRIFSRFSRVSTDTLFRSAGTGLGLNIAQNLIALMNGTVSVHSRLGVGTTFTIRIPFPIPDTVVTSVSVPLDPGLRKGGPELGADRSIIDILIVEDNELNQKVLEGFLSRYRVKPVMVNNGLGAVTILEKKRFDLILMDIQMPEMDGYTATQIIRQRLALSTPIIALTAYTMPGERERCLAVGMNAYLAKPIRIEHFDEILTQFAPGLLLNSSPITHANETDVEKELIDRAYLDEVTGGDLILLGELLSLFTRDLPQYRQVLMDAVHQKDRATFNQTAHKFRSSLNSLAMLGIAEHLKKLENDDQGFELKIGGQLAKLWADIDRGLAVLENLLTGTSKC